MERVERKLEDGSHTNARDQFGIVHLHMHKCLKHLWPEITIKGLWILAIGDNGHVEPKITVE